MFPNIEKNEAKPSPCLVKKLKNRLCLHSEIFNYKAPRVAARNLVVGIVLKVEYCGVGAVAVVGNRHRASCDWRRCRRNIALRKSDIPRVGLVAIFVDYAAKHSVLLVDVACGLESSRRYGKTIWLDHNLDAELLLGVELHNVELPHIEPCAVVVAKAICIAECGVCIKLNLQILGQGRERILGTLRLFVRWVVYCRVARTQCEDRKKK